MMIATATGIQAIAKIAKVLICADLLRVLFGRMTTPLFAPIQPTGEPEHPYTKGQSEKRSHQEGNRKVVHSRKLPSMRLP